MIITLPDLYAKSTLDLIGKLNIKELCDIEEDVYFDFKQTKMFNPMPMLVIGDFIGRVGFQRKAIGRQTAIANVHDKTYAGTMGFFKYINEAFPIGKAPGEAPGNENYVPITELSLPELRNKYNTENSFVGEDGEIMEQEASKLSITLDRGNRELHKILTYSIREILRNVPEHSETESMWVCSQYWKTNGQASIGILDKGIGIYNSITKNKVHSQHITDNVSALKWALKAGISQSLAPDSKQKSKNPWSNSGFGLYMVSEICKNLDGVFILASEGDYIIVNSHGLFEGKTNIKGTAISITIDEDKVLNAQALITEMSKQGESQAAEIRGAFKEASIPSRTLMTKLGID